MTKTQQVHIPALAGDLEELWLILRFSF